MKKLIAISIMFASCAVAGPLKAATYPVVHPKKDFHAAEKTVKGVGKALKFVLW